MFSMMTREEGVKTSQNSEDIIPSQGDLEFFTSETGKCSRRAVRGARFLLLLTSRLVLLEVGAAVRTEDSNS